MSDERLQLHIAGWMRPRAVSLPVTHSASYRQVGGRPDCCSGETECRTARVSTQKGQGSVGLAAEVRANGGGGPRQTRRGKRAPSSTHERSVDETGGSTCRAT